MISLSSHSPAPHLIVLLFYAIVGKSAPGGTLPPHTGGAPEETGTGECLRQLVGARGEGMDQEKTEELSLRQFTEGGNHKISKQSQGRGAVFEWVRWIWNVGFSGTW